MKINFAIAYVSWDLCLWTFWLCGH